MKMLYLLWGYFYDQDIIKAFEDEKIKVYTLNINDIFCEKKSRIYEEDGNEKISLLTFIKNYIKEKQIDIVFSINFFSEISDLCVEESIPYCCWVLQLPNFDLYTSSVFNICNYIAINDSFLVEKLLHLGIEKIFFLPDAVSEVHLKITDFIERELCFVDKQPVSTIKKHELSNYSKGYLDAFINFQRVLSGKYVLENGLINRVYNEIIKDNCIPKKILQPLQKLYVADYYLAPECTIYSQNIFLQNNSNIFTIYSDYDFPMCNCEKYAYPMNEEKKDIYRKKEFTLILPPYMLHNGIPREIFEVIISGGFPICRFQKDYEYFFEKDVNLAYFRDNKEFYDNIEKYGNNISERRRLQKNAYESVLEKHTYKNRIITMLDFWSKV